MAELIGRKVTLTPSAGGPVIAGMRTKSVSINNEPVDVTTDDDSGFKTYLDVDPSERSIEISVDGLITDASILGVSAGTDGVDIVGYDMLITGIGTISGDFVISGIEIGASYNDAVTFSATLKSSGQFTWTAAA